MAFIRDPSGQKSIDKMLKLLTFDSMKEILHRSLVISKGILEVFSFVLLCSFRSKIYGFLKKKSG